MRPALVQLIAGALALAATGRAAEASAAVQGRVALPKAAHAPVLNQRYTIIARDGVLAADPPLAVVYLEGGAPAPLAAPLTVQMVQKDLNFQPALLPVQVGTRVEFPNLDDTYHNIFSFSPAKRFDLGRYRGDERPIPSELFDTAGMVTLRCDIHEHMRAIILVLPTPHFVLTDPAGDFQLNGLRAGHYVLKAWVNSRTTREQPVDLAAGTTLRADFP